MLTLAVALAAGVGAVLRYVVDQLVQHHRDGRFPFGTFVVNVSGSLLLGLVVGLAAHHHFPSGTTLVIGTGFAGGYTTLSTWAWESVALAEAGSGVAALVNVVGSLVLGIVAAAAGLGLALL